MTKLTEMQFELDNMLKKLRLLKQERKTLVTQQEVVNGLSRCIRTEVDLLQDRIASHKAQLESQSE